MAGVATQAGLGRQRLVRAAALARFTPRPAPAASPLSRRTAPSPAAHPPPCHVTSCRNGFLESAEDVTSHMGRMIKELPSTKAIDNMLVAGKDKDTLRLESRKPVVVLLGSGWGAHSILKVGVCTCVQQGGPRRHVVWRTGKAHRQGAPQRNTARKSRAMAHHCPLSPAPGHRYGHVRGGLRVSSQPLPVHTHVAQVGAVGWGWRSCTPATVTVLLQLLPAAPVNARCRRWQPKPPPAALLPVPLPPRLTRALCNRPPAAPPWAPSSFAPCWSRCAWPTRLWIFSRRRATRLT